MTSNSPSSLQSRQKLHRRQNSIPVAFEATKVHMPPNTIQRQILHRRGQSYDVSRPQLRRQQYPGSAVSMHTNIGPIQGQQILREAQQQRTARPGQQQLQPRLNTSAQQCGFMSAPQHPSIDMSYDMSRNGMIQAAMPQQSYQNMQFPMQPDLSNAFMLDENNPNYLQMFPMQNLEQMMPMTDRRMSQPDLRIQTGLRPYTPTQQLQTAHFPLTPVHTPLQQQAVPHTRSLQTSPRWRERENTIVSPRPVSMQKSRSLQGIAEQQEFDSFNEILETPELPMATKSFSSAEPTKSRRPAHIKSESIASIDTAKPLFGEVLHVDLALENDGHPVLSPDKAPSSPSRPALSPRRMSISDLNLEPGISASINETDITLDDIAQYIEGPAIEDNKWICKFEGCDKRFGRKENIKSHVQTHLGDRQFKCNHCKKCFVRGHDLKRHAKIHTGAKAYACLCGNAFARHDALTRHRQRGMCIGAFEGIVRKEVKRGRPKKQRPDMDERVDKASRTRHNKQQGSVSVTNGIDVYTSSASSCSLSSWGSPPADTMDSLSIHEPSATSPVMRYADNVNIFNLASQEVDMLPEASFVQPHQSAMQTDIFSFTPPASPGYSTGNKPSPNYRELTPEDFASFTGDVDITITSGQPMTTLGSPYLHNAPQLSPRRLDESKFSSQAASNLVAQDQFDLPTMSQSHQHLAHASQATSLPSLSHSSSPPPQEPTSALVFDFPDDNPLRMSTMSNMSFGLSALNKPFDSNNGNSSNASQRNEFDSFLDYNDESQMSLGLGLSTDNNDSFFDTM